MQKGFYTKPSSKTDQLTQGSEKFPDSYFYNNNQVCQNQQTENLTQIIYILSDLKVGNLQNKVFDSEEMVELENQLEEKLNISVEQENLTQMINDVVPSETYIIDKCGLNSSFEDFTLFPLFDANDNLSFAQSEKGCLQNCTDEFLLLPNFAAKQKTPREITFNPEQNKCDDSMEEFTFGKPKQIKIKKFQTVAPIKKSIKKQASLNEKKSSLI